jgi:hypothetical protein
MRRITLKKDQKLNVRIMKSLSFEFTNEIFDEFAMTVEEMINVRGGGGDPESMPTPPPIKI